MNRLERVRLLLDENNVEAIVVTSAQNRQYLSGFSGSSGALLISAKEAVLITDFRYWEQAVEQAPDFMLHQQAGNLWDNIGELVNDSDFRRIAFEGNVVSYCEFQNFRSLLSAVELIPLTDELNKLRSVKDKNEIALLAKAAEITDYAWMCTMEKVKVGVSELDVATEFDYQLRLNGADGSSFPTIVAAGKRSSLPHAQPGPRKIESGDFLLLDGAALYRGYHGDMTRTVVVGNASERQKSLYSLVLKSQQKVLERLCIGMTGREGDAIAREIIEAAGYGQYFGHGLGHSVGLEIHENPRLSTSESARLAPNMVVTVEPGVYLPNFGGVRIEDVVVLTENGLINLTKSPKDELWEI